MTPEIKGKHILNKAFFSLSVAFILYLISCEGKNNDIVTSKDCTSGVEIDKSRGAADQSLSFTPEYTENVSQSDKIRTIVCNHIPKHKVGLFGKGSGSLNPNAITAQKSTYKITTEPKKANSLTPLLGNNGPTYEFGILKNGVILDPIAAEPFPHNKDPRDPSADWNWNLEPLNVNLGLDASNAHVQPNGKYHYHGEPTLFLEGEKINPKKMTLIGYAADGFPIYYKYAYKIADDTNSEIIEMTSSYTLKKGERPGDGVTAPCGSYDGAYTADYEYKVGQGILDQANGREGVTPEYPEGTYYYVITSEFPVIPRYFRGSPSDNFSFKMQR